MQVQPYLFFDGRCEEALEFYRSALGAEVEMLMRFKDSPEPPPPGMVPPGSENKVMHSSFRIGDATVMASDGRCTGQPSFQGFSLSLTVADEAEAERLFAALADGGQVQMPLSKTFFSPRFGMVADRFGVSWMVVTCVLSPGSHSRICWGKARGEGATAPDAYSHSIVPGGLDVTSYTTRLMPSTSLTMRVADAAEEVVSEGVASRRSCRRAGDGAQGARRRRRCARRPSRPRCAPGSSTANACQIVVVEAGAADLLQEDRVRLAQDASAAR